jgi:hypothetical protein
MNLSINDDPARGPEIEIEEHCSDTFVVVNGLTIARRGPPDTPGAGIWVSLEPTNGLSDLHHDQRSRAKERQLLEDMWTTSAFESPQSELRGKCDENSDRRGDRCDRPAVGSPPESETSMRYSHLRDRPIRTPR